MPQLRPPHTTKDRCPRCGGALIHFVVLSGGKREHCRMCGFLRDADSLPDGHGSSLESVDIGHLLCYAQAVLQTVHQVRVCRRCQTQIAALRSNIGTLSRQREAYASNLRQCDERQIDAFLDEMTEQLQEGISQLCSACRQRMEHLTWELLIDLLLEERDQQKEP